VLNSRSDSTPCASDLRNRNNDNKEAIQEDTQNMAESLNSQYERFVEAIRSDPKGHSDVANNMIEQAKQSVDKAITDLEESKKEAMFMIDEDNDVSSMFIAIDKPILVVLGVLSKILFNKDYRNILNIYYNTNKNNIIFIYIPLALLISLAFYYSPIVICDAPRA
jgi:predicted P-loop ATPase/GTPase